MVREDAYALLQVSETADSGPEDVESAFASNDGAARTTRAGVTKYTKALAVLLLVGVGIGIYSVANSHPGATGQVDEKEYEEDHSNAFYEVSEDVDTTAPAQSSTVEGQLGLSVGNPDAFANDPQALLAVKESIAEIAGVPVSAVQDVNLVTVNGAVQANFKIDVPAGQGDQVADQISSSDPNADSAILSQKIADAGLSATYPDAKVTEAEATPVTATTTQAPVTPSTTTPLSPCVTTSTNPGTPAPANPCATTLVPNGNPCGTTAAPVNPCATTPAPTGFGRLSQVFR